MTFDEFIIKWLGKKADFDGAYQGQCVDLFRFYVQDVLQFPQPKGVSGAADFWTNYPTDLNLNQYYEKIANTPDGVPQKGDVMIWNKNTGGGFGHISIFIEGTVSQFVSFDQNWPALSVCTKTTHNYTNVYGWLRPKKTTTIQIEASKFEELVTKATKYDEFVKGGFNSLDQVKQVIEKAQNEALASSTRVKELESKLITVEKELVECQNNPKTVEVIKEVPVEVIKEVEKEVIKEVLVAESQLGALSLITLALKAVISGKW